MQATASKQARIVIAGVLDTFATGEPAMVFDGADDAYLSESAIAFASPAATILLAMEKLNCTTGIILEHGPAPLLGGFSMIANYSAGVSDGCAFASDASNYGFSDAVTGALAPKLYPLLLDIAGASADARARMRFNGTDVDESQIADAGVTGAGALVSEIMYIGGRGASEVYYNGKLHTALAYNTLRADIAAIEAVIQLWIVP